MPSYAYPKDQASIYVESIHAPDRYESRRPHRHNYFEIMLFKTGSGSHVINQKKYVVSECSAHIISPQHIHLLNQGSDTEGVVIIFEKFISPDKDFSLEYPFFHFLNANHVLDIEPGLFNEIWALQKLLEKEIIRTKNKINAITNAYLTIILSKLMSVFKNETSINDPVVKSFLYLLEQHYTTEHKAVFYAQLLHISPTQLTKKTTETIGLSPKEIIQIRLFDAACKLLLFSEMSVKEIAFTLGFFDAAHFTKFFENKQGMSPKKFKEAQKV